MTQPHTCKSKTKPKPKVATKKKQQDLEKTTRTPKKRGRSSDNDEDSSDSYDNVSDEGEPVTKAKKRKIAEIEFVEDDVEPLPEVVMDVLKMR